MNFGLKMRFLVCVNSIEGTSTHPKASLVSSQTIPAWVRGLGFMGVGILGENKVLIVWIIAPNFAHFCTQSPPKSTTLVLPPCTFIDQVEKKRHPQ